MASKSSTNFGWNLFLNLLSKDQDQDNLFLSPFSISLALAMTRLGAKGETADGMDKTLCWQSEANVIHKEFQELTKLLKKPGGNCILRTANRIYIEKGYTILDSFMEQAKDFYRAEPVAAQFSSNYEVERVNINKWVEEQTENKIKDLLQSGVLDQLTKMVLVNAIYFKGQWESQFEANMTRPGDFFLAPSTKKQVPMMHIKKKFPYAKADGYAVLELPYKGAQLSMVIFLPDEHFGLKTMAKKISTEEITNIMANLHSSTDIEVSLPRFEISSSFELKSSLSQLGMSKAFDLKEADFSGMTGIKDLYISEVIHKAYLKVNEEGSEAAAATAVVMTLRCAMVPRVVRFIVDHPFLVVIRHIASDTILFMGHVSNPSELK